MELDPKDHRRYVNNVKLYFSSLTARRGNFLYTGISDRKNEYILSNLEPEKYIKYCDATFGIHILKLKDELVIKDINRVLALLDLPATPYVTRITAVLSLLNKYKFDSTQLSIAKDKNNIMYHIDPAGKKTILGYPMVIYQATQFLGMLYQQHCDITNTSDRYICRPVDLEALDQGTIKATFSMQDYTKLPDTGLDLTGNETSFSILLVDGAETISNREYIKKIKRDHTYELVTWIRNGCIEYATLYSDEFVEVRSTRPHTRIYIKPKPKK